MAKFLSYVKAMNIIEGDTEGDATVYLQLRIKGFAIQGKIAIFEFYPITVDAVGANANKGIISIPLEVYATNQNMGNVILPFPSVDADGEIRTVRGQIFWPVIQTDGFMTFEPYAQVTLPQLQVSGDGNPNRIYELCLDTNEGL